MAHHSWIGVVARSYRMGAAGWLTWAALSTGMALGQDAQPAPPTLDADTAVAWALEHNPTLTALRQQHGFAAGAIVISRTYPFNPVWTNKVFADNGPESAGITSRIAMEQRVAIDLELYHQGTYRQQAAQAGLSRTDFDIANSELLLAIRATRAFSGVLYRQQKLRLIEETIKLNEDAAEQVAKLVGGKLRAADLILAQTEVDAAKAQIGLGRAPLLTAWAEFAFALGITEEHFALRGTLEAQPQTWDLDTLTRAALDRRPDLRARQAAVGEAEARLRLERANRWGNPNLGPDYEYNETRVNFIGFQLTVPLPVLNTKRGEIMQRTAERDRAIYEMRALEVQIRQQVEAALRRLEEAEKNVTLYRTQVIPNLQKSLEGIERLFLENEPNVDVVRIIDVRRKLLRARDGYLDVLWESSQARADLAAAVGDPGLAIVAPPKP
jgi:cobalt-zinc-cadmium efflux system outer membrane protein